MTATALAPRASSAARRDIPTTTRCIRTLPALERELSDGVLQAWKTLVQADPLASPFQSPGWCVPWYRSYHDEFDPFVVAVIEAGTLVGVVPLAVHRSTNEIGFASGTMADYRDIVALPGARALMVDELIRVYLEGRFPNPLQIGWIDPSSDTPSLVANACRARGARFVQWQQPCYRWMPMDGENLNKRFSRLRTHLNHFKRLGNVSFDVVSDPDLWSVFRDAFFEQHSLRQLQADRPITFDDPRKRRFYDRLFDSTALQTHVTAMRLDGELLSGHIGFVWRDVLMLGAPSIALEHEHRSPALILLSWIMQNAAALGLKGFDLTIGDTEFKRRLGNRCVKVTQIEVFGSSRDYWARRIRTEAVAVSKAAVATFLGRDGWRKYVQPRVDWLERRSSDLARVSRPARALTLARDAAAAARVRYAPRAFRRDLTARANVSSSGDPIYQLRDNCLGDLLRSRCPSAATRRALAAAARQFRAARQSGQTLRTLVVDGELTAWAYTSAVDAGEPGHEHKRMSVEGLVIVPEFRGLEAVFLERLRAAGGVSTELTLTNGDQAGIHANEGAGVRHVSPPGQPQSLARLLPSALRYERLLALIRRLNWKTVRRRIVLLFHNRAEERLYRLSSAEALEFPADHFNRDRWEDLERFTPGEARHSREGCLAEWRSRLARGEHVFTAVEDGRLVSYGWMVERQRTAVLGWTGHTVTLPDHAAVLYDFYTLPEYRHRDFYPRLLMHALHEGASLSSTHWIYVSVKGDDVVPRWWVERLGFTYLESYFLRRVLWHREMWRALAP